MWRKLFFLFTFANRTKFNRYKFMNEKYVIGIDLGGTNTVIGLVDAKGNILGKDDSIKTQAHPEIEEYTDAIANVVAKLAKENGCEGKIEGVGIGAPMANY